MARPTSVRSGQQQHVHSSEDRELAPHQDKASAAELRHSMQHDDPIRQTLPGLCTGYAISSLLTHTEESEESRLPAQAMNACSGRLT